MAVQGMLLSRAPLSGAIIILWAINRLVQKKYSTNSRPRGPGQAKGPESADWLPCYRPVRPLRQPFSAPRHSNTLRTGQYYPIQSPITLAIFTSFPPGKFFSSRVARVLQVGRFLTILFLFIFFRATQNFLSNTAATVSFPLFTDDLNSTAYSRCPPPASSISPVSPPPPQNRSTSCPLRRAVPSGSPTWLVCSVLVCDHYSRQAGIAVI